MKILVDADALFGSFVLQDPHYKISSGLFKKLKNEKSELFVINFVLHEVATVLSHKAGQKQAIEFLDKVESLELKKVMLDERLEALGWKVFLKQTKKGTSFVDCVNLAVIKELKLDGMLSFDSFYPKKLTKWMRGVV